MCFFCHPNRYEFLINHFPFPYLFSSSLPTLWALLSVGAEARAFASCLPSHLFLLWIIKHHSVLRRMGAPTAHSRDASNLKKIKNKKAQMEPSSGLDGSESANHPWKYAGTLPTGIFGNSNIRLRINIQIYHSSTSNKAAQVELLILKQESSPLLCFKEVEGYKNKRCFWSCPSCQPVGCRYG